MNKQKNILMRAATGLTAALLCLALAACGNGGTSSVTVITGEQAQIIADDRVALYVENSDSLSGKYDYYNVSRGSDNPEITDDAEAYIFQYNTLGGVPAFDSNGAQYTKDDIVVLVSGDGKTVTVLSAPDMYSGNKNSSVGGSTPASSDSGSSATPAE